MLTIERSVLFSALIIASSIAGPSVFLRQPYSFEIANSGGVVSVIRGDSRTGKLCVFPAGLFAHSTEKAGTQPSGQAGTDNNAELPRAYWKYLTQAERDGLVQTRPGDQGVLTARAADLLPRSRPGVALPTCY